MRNLMLIAGPAVATGVGGCLAAFGSAPQVAWTAAVTTLCAVWWISEAVPIPVTALVPLAVFPMVGVLRPEEVGAAYGSPVVLLMLGGFMLSSAMERSGAHRRMALTMVSLFGGASGRQLVFGFMTASALLSMWISNAATSLMLLPIVMAVLERVTDLRLRVALLLGIAYGASVGGVGTPIGTPPNLIFMEVYRQYTGDAPTFTQWMACALPVVLVMLPVTGLWLTRGLQRQAGIQMPAVGTWRAEEIRTLTVFAITALLWVTRREPWDGWSGLLGMDQANDASVALLAVIALFVIPNGKGGRLLDWQSASRIRWGVLILFGGGITIAKAFISSGLSASLGGSLAGIAELPWWLMIGIVCLSVTFLTEVTSNTATATLLMPILASAALAAGVEPRLLMVPAVISASFAFMLPVATPPNAIVFGSGAITVQTMAREGLILNLAGAFVVTSLSHFLFR